MSLLAPEQSEVALRARALSQRRVLSEAPAEAERHAVRPLSADGLVFLRGRDADGRLRELAAARRVARPVLGALAAALVEGRVYEKLGYRHRAPALASAFRRGRIHAFQALVLARVADVLSARSWVERARQVSFRRLEGEVEVVPPVAVAFHAPPDVARLFLEMVRRAGSLERLLAHAILTWVEDGQQFRDYADFERDEFCCVAPGCTARRNLQSHHMWMRSHCGPDVAWNRVTLCASHHQHGVHGDGALRILGRAPDGLVFELGEGPPERFTSGDVRLPTEAAGRRAARSSRGSPA